MVVFDDMELERKVTIYEKGPWQPTDDLRRVADPHRRHLQPEDPERRAAAARVPALPRPRRPARATARARRRTALAVVRVLEQLQASLVARARMS